MGRLARGAAVLLFVGAALAATAATQARTAAAVPTQTLPGTCRHIAGPFHTVGDRVLNSKGERYIPDGINVVGLAHPLGSRRASGDEAQIEAAASYWCANTVRLQISQDLLVASNGSINEPFLAAIEAEVSFARAHGLLVALNLASPSAAEYMPTARSETFWSTLSAQYGKDPGVIFDIFNEPRNVQTWQFWRNGGTRDGVRYYGMQTLASFIRSTGARNLLWVEGLHSGGSLRQVWAYRLRGVSPLMYDLHRPPPPITIESWRSSFGYLAEDHLAPVLDGEWADYARTAAPWACWDNSPVSVPIWLRYLREHQIGLIASQLVPGELLESANFDDPTQLKANWSCTSGLDEGAGSLVMQWFQQQNGPTLYAAASPVGAADCYRADDACTLQRAMAEVAAGDTILLVTPGDEHDPATWYRGGFRIRTPGTSASSPITIEAARGVTGPILDGGRARTVLRVGNTFLDLIGVTVQHGSATSGGGISNNRGGTLELIGSTFLADRASADGGAIDNGDHGGSGTLIVTRSTFEGGQAGLDGGAIDNGDNGGNGTLTVSGSTFAFDRAGDSGDSIDDGDNGGIATATVGADVFADSCAQVSGTWNDLGYNVGSSQRCFDGGPGDVSSIRAGFLAAAGDYGGGIDTMPPITGNPAIGNVPNPTPGLCPTIDERNAVSKPGTPCDAGAVQGSEKAQRPAVSLVSPDTGPVDGGTRITITGANFLPGAKVLIAQGEGLQDSVRATDVDLLSAHKLTAVTAAGKSGDWNLYVLDAGMASAATVRFTYRL